MKNVVSLLLLFFVLLGTASLFSQDVPVSTGPAPYAYNVAEPSVVFGDLAATSRVWTINATSITASQWRNYFAGTPGTSTVVGPVHAYFFGSGDQCGTTGNQQIYVIQQVSPYSLFSTDTVTGSVTNLGAITGILPGHSSGGITSLAWDATTNTAYCVSTSITESQLYTFNLTTRVATPVGSPITNAPGIIALAINPAGSLFAIDIVNDNLWRMNKTTGTATLVGSLGYGANFGQDADFDPRDGILYWAAIGTGVAQLRTVDTATGTSTLVGNLTGFGQGLATIVPYATGPALANDYAVGPFLSLPGSFAVGNSYNIKAKVQNVGTNNQSNVPIKFYVDGTQAASVNLSLNAGAVDSVSFPWTAVSGNHTLTIASALSNDENRANDTVRTTVTVLAGTPTYGGTVTVCRTGISVPILDNQTARDSLQITIPAWGFGIQDVNVTIQQVIHTWDSDLEFHILHGSVDVNIIDNVGGSGDNFINTVLNDSATTPIASGTAPFTGSFIPSNPLAAFNSQTANPNGTWTLTIADGAGGDTGVLNAWCVTLNYYTYVGGVGTITVPNYYALGQNYPNPFNPSTKINFALPEAGNVKIIIFDILGREITTLVNEYKTSGIYTVDFDASSLSSGVYFYRMESGSFTDTKKMLLVK